MLGQSYILCLRIATTITFLHYLPPVLPGTVSSVLAPKSDKVFLLKCKFYVILLLHFFNHFSDISLRMKSKLLSVTQKTVVFLSHLLNVSIPLCASSKSTLCPMPPMLPPLQLWVFHAPSSGLCLCLPNTHSVVSSKLGYQLSWEAISTSLSLNWARYSQISVSFP